MKIVNQTILVTSNEPWGDIWYSKQNYAYELSRSNTVIFVNPPPKWRIIHLFSIRLKLEQETANLSSLNYGNFIPVRTPLLNRINNSIVSRKIRKFLNKHSIKPDILWAFDPMRLYIPSKLAPLAIYHCVDYYYFKFYGERQLCQFSDLIFATSQLFLDEFKEFETPKHVVPHGISRDEFILEDGAPEIPYENYGLYIGVIDHRMDFEMYEAVIQTFPQQLFVFVGPLRLTEHSAAQRIFKEQIYDNVVLTGPKHFKQLKYFIGKSSFCMSFMDMTYHANTVHHHKTLVYLAQGKPVFSFAYKEYKSSDNIMYLSNEKAELIEKIKKFLAKGEPETKTSKRIEYAQRFTFENILDQAGNHIVPLLNRA